METNITSEEKTIGIIAYLTLIGFIIAIVMNSKKSEYANFHIRQSLGIFILAIALMILANIFVFVLNIGILSWIFNILIFVFWILGFIGAVQGEKKLVPVLGAQFQEWFKTIIK